MALPVSSKGGSWHSWPAGALRLPSRLLVCVAGSLLAALFTFTWSREDLDAGLNDIRFQEDKDVVRFSEHCAAPAEGAEGELPRGEGHRLHGVAVLFGHGDSSPVRDWPGEALRAVAWDCRPEALPRYWRLNKHVTFPVLGLDGTRLERSLTPSLLEEADDALGGYACARGQLTAVGFRQAVHAGRHLAQAYGAQLGRAASRGAFRLHAASADTTRSLASAVGLLMALLAAPEVVSSWGPGTEATIHLAPNASLDTAGAEALLGDMELSEHLLSRWCHQLAWPCHNSMLEGSRCVSLQQAAALVRESEAGACRALPAEARPLASPLLAEVERLRNAQEGLFTVSSTAGQALTAALKALLGAAACNSPLSARPPFASRLVIERWLSPAGDFRWRFLWNGADVSAQVIGCSGQRDPGCSDQVVSALFSGP